MIILYANDESQAKHATQKAFQRINDLEQIMSDYLPESEVSLLSKHSGDAHKTKVSKDLFKVLKKSKKWSKKTNGSFDITIGPLSKLWRRAFRQKEMPDSSAILASKKLVNYKWIKVFHFSKNVKLKKQNMRIDLGGIAKGYAVDEAMKVLKKQGIKSALIEGGGDILVSEAPPEKEGWEIFTPGYKKHYVLKNKAIATSGAQYKYIQWKGEKYSHIINPISGYGMTHRRTITVITKTCADADALASSCSVMDHAEIAKFKKNKKWRIFIE